MQTHSNESKEAKKFPETLQLPETGGQAVLLCKEIRHGIKTQYGERTVVEAIERATKARVSVWWPKGVPVPPTNFPIIFARVDKKTYRVVTCDTRDEALELWKTGEVKNPSMSSANVEADFS